MTVSCAVLGCELQVSTATRAQQLGWTQLKVTVGRLTPPEGGTLHVCPKCWPQISRAAFRPYSIALVKAG